MSEVKSFPSTRKLEGRVKEAGISGVPLKDGYRAMINLTLETPAGKVEQIAFPLRVANQFDARDKANRLKEQTIVYEEESRSSGLIEYAIEVKSGEYKGENYKTNNLR